MIIYLRDIVIYVFSYSQMSQMSAILSRNRKLLVYPYNYYLMLNNTGTAAQLNSYISPLINKFITFNYAVYV